MKIERGLALFWLVLGAGCVDPIVVGEQPACEPACQGGLHCNLELQQCVQCTIDDDCSARTNAPYCEGFGCVQCRGDQDCDSNSGRTCRSGACVECVVDADCDRGFEPFETHVCELGACVDSFMTSQ